MIRKNSAHTVTGTCTECLFREITELWKNIGVVFVDIVRMRYERNTTYAR